MCLGKCLYLAGFIPEPMNAYDDYKLIQHGIGFTNIVARTTRGSADLTRQALYMRRLGPSNMGEVARWIQLCGDELNAGETNWVELIE